MGCDNSLTSELSAAAFGLGALAALIADEPVEDDDFQVSDRKLLAEEFRKKEELGMKM